MAIWGGMSRLLRDDVVVPCGELRFGAWRVRMSVAALTVLVDEQQQHQWTGLEHIRAKEGSALNSEMTTTRLGLAGPHMNPAAGGALHIQASAFWNYCTALI